MSKKDKKSHDSDLDDFLNQAVPQHKFSVGLVPVYVIPATFASVASTWVFYSIFHLDGSEYYPLFVAVSAIVVALLCFSFFNTNKSIYTRLASSRPETQAPIGEKNAEKLAKMQAAADKARSATATEGSSFAVLYNTLLYIALFVLLGFLIGGRLLPATFNYPASTIISAGLVYAASRAK